MRRGGLRIFPEPYEMGPRKIMRVIAVFDVRSGTDLWSCRYTYGGKGWTTRNGFYFSLRCYFIGSVCIPNPLMMTLTRVMTNITTTMTSLRMSAVRWSGSSLMFIPPITRKRMPTTTWKRKKAEGRLFSTCENLLLFPLNQTLKCKARRTVPALPARSTTRRRRK